MDQQPKDARGEPEDERQREPDPDEPERKVEGIAGESEAVRKKDAPERAEDEASWESFPASDAPAY